MPSPSYLWSASQCGMWPILLLVNLGCFVIVCTTILGAHSDSLSATKSSSSSSRIIDASHVLPHDQRRRLSSSSSSLSARNRQRERATLVKPIQRTDQKGPPEAVAPVNNNQHDNTNIMTTKNTEFLNTMDQEHLPMFQLSDFTVLGTSSFPKPSAMAERLSFNHSILSTTSPIVPYLKPVHGTHRATADAVFLFAAEYPLSSYILFISSLRLTGYDGDIVIAISQLDWNDKAVRSYLSHDPHVIVYAIEFSCFNAEWEAVTSVKGGMRVCQCHQLYGRQPEGTQEVIPLPDPREPRTIATTRYELYWIWVQAYHPHVWMLLIDARDSWFQTNPFDNLPRQEQKGGAVITSGQLYLFGENIEATRIGRSEKNRKWLESAYGDKVVSALENKPTICSGSTMGERMAIETYLRAMVAESDETGTKLMGADQGFHNYLYYSGKLQMATSVSKIVVFDQGRGRINNLGAMRIKPLEEWGNGNIVKQLPDGSLQVFNWDGTLSPVVHQFDRHKQLSVYIYDTLTNRYQKQWKEQQQHGASAAK